MRVTKLSFTLLFLLLSVLSFAQKGWIRGTVYDGKTGEFLPGVTIFAEGTTSGTITDLDGAFSLSIEPGTYQIRISFISYSPLLIKDVPVKAGEATILENLTLQETTIEIGEAVVTARAIQNTEIAMLSMKKNSVNVLDAISSTELKRTGDSDAAASLKRVTGVSVEGGKYVFVRGLGDRYTKTILNGVDMPGLDPDRNTLQMDIFPSGIIGNMVVNKTFSADLPADFTGGVININIKDFPETKTADISASLGYNPDMHFNSGYLRYEGGKTDFLGFDDGTRDIPVTTDIPFFADVAGKDPKSEKSIRYKQILESFDPTLAASKEKSFIDFGLGASFGNQFEAGKYTLGYTLSFSYKNNTEFYENAEYGQYGLQADKDEEEMEVREFQTGNYGVNDVMLSGMAGFAIKTNKAKYRIYLMRLQNGQSKAGVFDYAKSNEGTEFSGFQHNLEYNQRALTNLLIDGKYNLSEHGWEIEWKFSPTFSSISDPDIRFTRYQVRNGANIIGTEAGFPERIWRDLEEKNLAGVLHITKNFRFNGEDARLKFGGAYTNKKRDFIIRNFALNIRNIQLTGDPNELFLPENLWPYQGNTNWGTTYEVPFIPNNPNEFNAGVSNMAGYVSSELTFFKDMKAVTGLRVENYVQHYTGKNQENVLMDNHKVLDKLNLFPTVNLIYQLAKNQNLRLSYAKTIARPSFKELSFAQIFDPLTGRYFIGGLSEDADDEKGVVYWDGNLVSTDIHNFDFRWELFQQRGQTLSASLFYKKFKNPIETVQFVTKEGSFQPRNVGDGEVSGAEIEMRQSLAKLSEKLKNMSFSLNFTYVDSKIEMSNSEYNSRLEYARTGEKIERTRDMAGQAPYLVNAGLMYDGNGGKGFWKGLDAGLFYNMQGQTLQYVGINNLPDVYSNPFHSLNFNMNKVLGEKERFQLGFKVENLLGAKRESVYQSYQANDQYFERLSPGTKFEFKLSYSLY